MMKKLVLGLAVCWSVTVSGMETGLVGSIMENPTSYRNVAVLVSSVMKDDTKITSAETELKKRVHAVSDSEIVDNELIIERICCMLYSLSRDLRSCNLSSVDYYVEGARKGIFGPFGD